MFRPISQAKHPVGFVGITTASSTGRRNGWGPAPDELCPCGSRRRSRSCHLDPLERTWKTPRYEPLLSDHLTGYSHARCYAGFTKDCSEKLSKEHWLSAGIIKSAGDNAPVKVRGLAWLNGKDTVLTANALGANILCTRHNTALSRLDTTAERVFSALDHYQQDLPEDPHGNEFALASGEELERWMLKLLWGATAAGVLSGPAGKITDIRETTDKAVLANYLFRDGSLPEGWALYIASVPGSQVSADATLSLEPYIGPEGHLWGAKVGFGVVSLRFDFGRPSRNSHGQVLLPRPQGAVIGSKSTPSLQKILALGWDRPSSEAAELWYSHSA